MESSHLEKGQQKAVQTFKSRGNKVTRFSSNIHPTAPGQENRISVDNLKTAGLRAL